MREGEGGDLCHRVAAAAVVVVAAAAVRVVRRLVLVLGGCVQWGGH